MADSWSSATETAIFISIMARYDHLLIFKSTYNLCLLTYRLTWKYGRDYKYTLGEKMKEDAHGMLDILVETNSVANCEKGKLLNALLLKVEQFRMYARISCDLELITPESLGKVAELMEEISKQAGAWKGWVESQR